MFHRQAFSSVLREIRDIFQVFKFPKKYLFTFVMVEDFLHFLLYHTSDDIGMVNNAIVKVVFLELCDFISASIHKTHHR